MRFQDRISQRAVMSACAVVLLVLVAFAAYSLLVGRVIPEIIGGSFDLESRIIPENAQFVEFTFSTMLDPDSVRSDSVSVSPALTGSISTHGSVIRYSFSESLSIGETYVFTVASGIRSDRGVSSESERTVELRVVSGARAIGVIPSDRLSDVSKNIVAMFNVPLVPLGSIDTRENLPCPLMIEPAVAGRCVWTSSTVVEFEPEDGFEYASRYHVTVNSASGLLYDLYEPKSVEFSTPELSFSVSDEFSVEEGIILMSNAPVDPESLRAKTVIRTTGRNIRGNPDLEAKPDDFVALPVRLENIDSSHRRFSVFPETGSFAYDRAYSLQIADGLMPEKWNVALSAMFDVSVRSTSLIAQANSVLPVEATDSETGEARTVLDNHLLSVRDGAEWDERTIHPQPEAALYLQIKRTDTSDDTIKLLRINPDTSTKEVSIDVRDLGYLDYLAGTDRGYRFDELNEGLENGSESVRKEVDTMESEYRFVRIAHAQTFRSNEQYSLVFPGDDFAVGLRVAATPKVRSFSVVDYTTACLSVSEPLRPARPSDSIYDSGVVGSFESGETSSEAALYEVSRWWTDHPCIEKLTEEQKKNESIAHYAIDMKLLPNAQYNFRLADVVSAYGVPLPPYRSEVFRTGEIPESVKLVDLGNVNGYQMMPSDVPFRIGVQTRNTDSFIVVACAVPPETGVKWWLEMDAYHSICEDAKRVIRTVENRYWKTTYTVIDIEKDVLGHSAGLYTAVFVGTEAEFARIDKNPQVDYPLPLRQATYMRSDLALAYEWAGNTDDILFLSRLDGSPVEGASFRFFTRGPDWNMIPAENGSIKAMPIPGSPGVYAVSRASEKHATIDHVIATAGESSVVVRVSDDSFGNSDFDAYSWDTVSATDFAFIHTDRPLYRPGDTVSFRGIVRRFDPRAGYRPYPSDRPLVVSYRDSTGNRSVESISVSANANGNFSGSFVVPADAKLGRNEFSVIPADDDSGNGLKIKGEFFVEEYKKPVFKTLVDVPHPDALYGDTIDVSAHGEYYFGGILKGARYQYDVLSQRAFLDRWSYGDYAFGTDDWWWSDSGSYDDSIEYSDAGVVADDGFARTRFSYPIPRSERSDRDSSDAPDVRAYTHRFSFVDPTSGQVVTNSATQIVYPTDVSVGLKTGLYFARAGEPLRVEGIVLDHDSKPVPGKSVSLELVRTEWKRIKKQGVDGLDYYDYSEVRTVESNLTISSDSNGAFSREFSPKSAGSYQVRAVYRGANGLSSLAARSIYVSGTDMVYWNDGNSSISDLISDKREYRPGETASLRFKAPIATGSLLVTVEKDDVILSTFTVPVSESLVPIEVPIKPEYLPNVYVKVLFVGRADPTGLPTVARGLANLNVLTGDKRLSVAISTDKRYYAPQDPMFVTVRISDAAGNPVSGAVGSLAVVDESLLALVGNPTLDPYSFFYVVKRFLGVSTASSLARLIEKLEIPDASDGEKGGGSMAGETRRLRGDFRDTAYWTAEYQTDDKGVAVVSVPNLPDNLTDWRIETVADASDRFGVGYATASTRRPVMLSSNLPNFFAEGDTMVLRPILSNRTDTPREFTVTLSSNIFATGSVLSRSVRIPAGADVPVELPVRVRPVREMPATLSAAVSMEMVDISDASMRDGETLTLPIAVSTMPEVTTTFGLVTGGAGQDERIRLSADEKDGILRINYAPSVFSYARSSFGFFSSYPYGCAEQITSSILPHVYEKQLADALDIPLDLKTHTIESYDRLLEASVRTTVDSALREYLSSIRAYQHSDGGIQYWKTTSEQPSYWLTSYVLDGLFEIERIGYEVDSGMVSRMISYLIFQFDNDLSKYAAMPVEGSEYPSDNAPKYSLEDHFSTIQVLARYDARNGTNESVGRFSAVLSESERRSGPMESRSLSERESFLETLAAVMATPGVPDSEKRAMRDRAAAMVETIFSDSLVINTRGAFLAERADDSRYARLDRTLRFVGIASMPDILDGRVDIREILPRMLRWAASETDDDGSYGTTMLSAAAVRTFARYLASTGELIDVNMTAKVFVNDRIIDETTIDASNKLGSQTKTIDLADLPENTSVRFERSGSGGIAYDLSLERRVPMLGAGAKSYGFLVKRSYYDATEYDRIRDAKSAEWDRYVRGEIDSTTLVYPNDPMEYLTPLERIPASGLIYASYRIVTPEARDFVAFEAQIPAGTMLVNPRLATDSGGKTVLSNPMFSYEEYRLDRYFGFARSLSAGEYEIRFALRATHRGTFFVPPARAFQFYEPESFGRSEASTLTVQ